jgi:regulatory protein
VRKSKPNSSPQLTPRSRALRLLARREHSRAELARKLVPHVEDKAELSALLDDLAQQGWISEARVVEQLIHAKRGRYGAARLRQLLLAKGVSDDLIAPALSKLKTGELDAARSVWSRKFRTAARSREERAQQVRFLQSRGFSTDAAMRVVSGRDDD